MTNPRRITRALIPAAGKGSRLLPLTRAVPKELLPLGKKPVLEHVVEECAACGIQEILFIISAGKEAIRAHFGDSAGGIRLSYAYQSEQKGLADAVFCGREFVGAAPFAVVLGDSVIETDQAVPPFRRVLDTFELTDAGAVVAVMRAPREEVPRYGIVKPKHGIGPVFEIEGVV
ncbi:MAG: sugar phosphate nucleotidyltransferase, partial [Armatimonadota bacterium]